MPHKNDDADPGAKRAAKRDSLLMLTEFRDEGGHLVATGRVRNLSATGLMAEYDGPLKEGDHVRMTLRGTGEIGGCVSWVRDGRMGVAFDQPIDPIAARRPIAASRPAVTPTFPSTRFGRPSR